MPRLAFDEGPGGLVTAVEVSFPTEPEIDRHEHQSRAMSDRRGERPKRQLRRSYPRQCPRMAPVDEPEDAEADDKEAGAYLDLALPFDERDQQRERKNHQQHRKQMAGRERTKRSHQRTRIPFHQSGRNGERPPHSRIYSVVEAARDDSQPEPGSRPIRPAQFQTDG